MRIVSLLPSATELICGLGLLDQLVGVSHECDYPASVVGLPTLTSSRIPPDLASDEIDKLVSQQLQDDQALYDLDVPRLIELAPDLIVTQALCDVCAVSGNDVARALGSLPGNPQLVNLEPICLDDVLATATTVATAAGVPKLGRDYVDHLSGRIARVAERSAAVVAGKRPRVALLDWLDPLFDGGHWSPEIISLAGGLACFGEHRQPSQRRSWQALIDAAPEVIVIALCGFNVARSMQDVDQFMASPGFAQLHSNAATEVYLVDGNAYFSRPGPRLVDALEITASTLHPNIHPLPTGIPEALKINP